MFCILVDGVWSSVYAAQKVTLYGDNDYAPYSFDRGGNPSGLYVDVLQEAARRITADYDVSIATIPWKRGLKALEVGEIFALFPPYLWKTQRPYISVYSEFLYEEVVAVFCTPDAALRVEGQSFPAGYAGMLFANNLGFIAAGEAFQKMRDAGTIRVEDANGTDVNIKKLLGARVDCYVNDRLSVQSAVKAAGGSGSEVVETAVVNAEKAYVGYSAQAIAVTPWANDFIEKLNGAIREMRADGSLQRLMTQ
ncbi:amino acid ABC transporter substrate-binding protein [Haematospirillum jordaniae]|uniref:substrate-binding periplasmic protein n=1 Tax=Haematospirillum jordaniae TaxID=1549855 RepID=UPI0014331B68|nr:transporter substrate-binding domain-containing protein [Haematospirillum jordaniae]NKD86117.1 amino acid ABC transporter substrate-binding protein [Haematospirillum jordaniae]